MVKRVDAEGLLAFVLGLYFKFLALTPKELVVVNRNFKVRLVGLNMLIILRPIMVG
jgi:hypothetical protein